jgi:tetratricopeptide (TPR) repeat protein
MTSRTVAHQLAAKGDFKQAIVEIKHLLHRRPTDAQLWLDLAHCHLELRQLSKARDCFEKVLTRNVNMVEAWFGYAITLEAEKDYARSFEAYQTVLRLDPECLPAEQHIAGLFLHTAQYGKAYEAFKALLVHHTSVTSLLGCALALDYAGKSQAACRAYQQVLAFKPNTRHREYLLERITLLEQNHHPRKRRPRSQAALMRVK